MVSFTAVDAVVKRNQHLKVLAEYHEKWVECKNCPLHKTQMSNCGEHTRLLNPELLPVIWDVDVLFVANKPDNIDAVLNTPMVSGRSTAFKAALKRASQKYYFTHVVTAPVVCTPWEDSSRSKIVDPPSEAFTQCSDHILELIAIYKPKKIVALSTSAHKQLQKLKLEHSCLTDPHTIDNKGGLTTIEFKKFYLQLLEILGTVCQKREG